MNLEIVYSKNADRFLSENANRITESEVDDLIVRAVKKILKIEEAAIDIKALRGEYRGYFRIRKGKIRIVFSLKRNEIPVAFIRAIDFRKDVYK
jgi:mRNA interferase RelE/StbE